MNPMHTPAGETVAVGANEALVEVQTIGRVGLIRLNRPRKLNALNGQMMDEATRALKVLSADPEIGAIVLTLRTRPGVRRQRILKQVSRRPEDAVTLVDVKPGQGASHE